MRRSACHIGCGFASAPNMPRPLVVLVKWNPKKRGQWRERTVLIWLGAIVINRLSMPASRQTRRHSTPRYPALHGAVNPGFQECNFGLAIEWVERRIQQFGPEAGFPDRSHRRPFGLIPGNIETIVRHRT